MPQNRSIWSHWQRWRWRKQKERRTTPRRTQSPATRASLSVLLFGGLPAPPSTCLALSGPGPPNSGLEFWTEMEPRVPNTSDRRLFAFWDRRNTDCVILRTPNGPWAPGERLQASSPSKNRQGRREVAFIPARRQWQDRRRRRLSRWRRCRSSRNARNMRSAKICWTLLICGAGHPAHFETLCLCVKYVGSKIVFKVKTCNFQTWKVNSSTACSQASFLKF
jgi:hypothetical protein